MNTLSTHASFADGGKASHSLNLKKCCTVACFIRDVNNYMAEGMDGKIKRIGAYSSETALENPGTPVNYLGTKTGQHVLYR